MLPLVLIGLLAADAAPTAPAPVPPETRPSLLFDAALAAGASAAVALGKPDIRRAIFRDARLSNVLENFTHPIAQVRAGTRRDVDRFWINYVAHPASFAVEGVYLRQRGYSRRDAFLFTQVHSVVWEFVIEGCAFEPSGKDLLTDAAGAAVGIWILDPLVRKLGLRGLPFTIAPDARGVRVQIDARF
jgi:hypothetical protein